MPAIGRSGAVGDKFGVRSQRIGPLIQNARDSFLDTSRYLVAMTDSEQATSGRVSLEFTSDS
jgi:hypothetical protein